jgi:hypothetical protein
MKRLNLLKPKPGFVYIMSNSRDRKTIKIGQTGKDPEDRALQFTKSPGLIGESIVEWSCKVSQMDLAEDMLHHKFVKYHIDGEHFKFPAKDAVKIANAVMSFFEQEISKDGKLVKIQRIQRRGNAIAKKQISEWGKIKKGRERFIRTAIDLCIKEARSGSTKYKAFMYVRTQKFTSIGAIHFYIQKKHIRVSVTCGEELKEKALRLIKNKFKYYEVEIPPFTEWRDGVQFLISNNEQFQVVKNWFRLGSVR